MRKLIAAINMTVDGYCDHTSMLADEEIHQHYTDLLRNAGVLLYGRTTYELMESYWPSLVKNPSGQKSMDDFATAIENIPKIVFSHTLKNNDPTITGWKNASLAKRDIKEEVLALKQQPGRDILAGSPSLIAAATKLKLVDEFQLCVHPVIAGKGLPLFRNITDAVTLRLIKTKVFAGGAITVYYHPA